MGQALSSVPQHDAMSTCQHASLPEHVAMSSRQHVSLPQHDVMTTQQHVPQHVNLPQHDAMSTRQHGCDVNPAACKLSETCNAAYRDDSSCSGDGFTPDWPWTDWARRRFDTPSRYITVYCYVVWSNGWPALMGSGLSGNRPLHINILYCMLLMCLQVVNKRSLYGWGIKFMTPNKCFTSCYMLYQKLWPKVIRVDCKLFTISLQAQKSPSPQILSTVVCLVLVVGCI